MATTPTTPPTTPGPTLAQLQAQLANLYAALGDPTRRNRTPDGRESENRPASELLTMIAATEEAIRKLGGTVTSRVRLAQHKRGDTPLTRTELDRW